MWVCGTTRAIMSAKASKKPCKNQPEYTFTGKEPSPLGLGYTAVGEEVGTVMEGQDGSMWAVTIKNAVHIWSRVPSTLAKEEPVLGRAEDPAEDEGTAEAGDTNEEEPPAPTPKKRATKTPRATKKKVTTQIAESEPEEEPGTPKEGDTDAAVAAEPADSPADSPAAAPAKKERKLTDFNLFMKHRMSQLKTEQPDMPNKERFATAATEWKDKDAQAKKDAGAQARAFLGM